MATTDKCAFQKLPTPCAITTLDGTILQVNAALNTLVGKTDSDLIGVHLDTITTLASGIFMQTHVWPMLRKDKRVRELYIKIKNAQGESTPIMADCALDQSDKDQKCFWIFYIAQERSKFEKELIRARQDVESINQDLVESRQALKTANDELERFILIVSHDLRAPLVSINGFASQLQKELSDHLNERQQHRFTRIASNVKKMQTLMDDLLKLSRITPQEIQFESVCLSKAINEQLAMIEKTLSDIDAKVHIDEPLPIVTSNPTLLGQCIGNLLTNTCAYRESARQLEIRIKAVTSGETVVLSISDNGIGIAEQDLERVFNMFEHISSTKGTGIGLAIVKVAVEKVQGSISVISEFGAGSTFSLTLPKSVSISRINHLLL
jgi:signal transduction histidine kinase